MNHLTRSPGLIKYLPIYLGLFIITFSVICATPFQYNMFQESAYSGGEPRQRNKWVVLLIMLPCIAYSYCKSFKIESVSAISNWRKKKKLRDRTILGRNAKLDREFYSSTSNWPYLYRNWCAHVVHKNVSGAVLSGTEVFVQPEHRPCPGRYPDCAQQQG